MNFDTSSLTPNVIWTGIIVLFALGALGLIGFGFQGHIHYN